MKSQSQSAEAQFASAADGQSDAAASSIGSEPSVSVDPVSQYELARARAAQLMNERKFTEAKKALEEADLLEAAAKRFAQAEVARAKASQLMGERKFTEARRALEEADALESGTEFASSGPRRIVTDFRARLQKIRASRSEDAAKADADADQVVGAVDKSMRTVSLYSKIAAGVGILPGGLLNYGAILAVDVVMVWKIANAFGHREGKERIRGSLMSLVGASVPTIIGHGAGMAITAIPAFTVGTLVYFVVTPVLAYAMTKAIGNTFIMHFESGGTLLDFDPKAFGEHFLKEFQKAGGTIASEEPRAVAV